MTIVKTNFTFLLRLFFALFLLTSVPAFADDERGDADITLQMNTNRSSWGNNASTKKEGGQNVLYTSLSYVKPQYGATLLGSFADTAYINNSSSVGDFHRFASLDSTISTFYNLHPIKSFSVRLGVDFNIPTGKPALSSAETSAAFSDKIVSELTTAPSLGTGFNIAPNISASKQIGKKSVLGLGIRYELTGKYDTTSDISNDNTNPGDVLSLFGSIQYLFSDTEVLFLDLSTTMYTRDEQDGQGETGKVGDQYSINARLVKLYNTMRITYGFEYGWQGKNQGKSTIIETEARNSNNNQYNLLANLLYPISGKTSITGLVGYKVVQKNGYDSADSSFDAGYSKFEFGTGFVFNISDTLYFNGNVRLFDLKNKEDATEKSNATYRGFFTDIGFVYNFSN